MFSLPLFPWLQPNLGINALAVNPTAAFAATPLALSLQQTVRGATAHMH